MKTILITGGCGFIGSNFIRFALARHDDWRIVNLDKLTYAGNRGNLADIENNERYTFIHGDICDRELVDSIIRDKKISGVINFAAESHVDRSIMDATAFIETNVRGTMVLLDAARKYGVERFLQISTDEVYGELGETGFFTEESPIRPNSPYAASKACADLMVTSYHRTYGLPIVIARSSNNYGPYQYPEKLIPLMIINAISGKQLPVYGDGSNVRDWLFVDDNCSAIERVLTKGLPGEIYNIGGGNEKRNIDIVRSILKLLEKSESLIAFVQDRPGHDYRYAIDSSKIINNLQWEPGVHFDQGLERTVRWYVRNESWWKKLIDGSYREYYSEMYKEREREM